MMILTMKVILVTVIEMLLILVNMNMIVITEIVMAIKLIIIPHKGNNSDNDDNN